MYTAAIQRRQYAVGHGGFHAGKIVVRKDEVQIPSIMLYDTKDSTGASTTVLRKTYVYDCGSESPQSFSRALRTHCLSAEEKTDLLFISHLDSDHVNKIDHLMGMAPARLVILPYLAPEDLSELLARKIENGTITASIRDYAADPVAWWRRRGADTIIFVEPSNGDDQAPNGGLPDRPIDPDLTMPPSVGSDEGTLARLACIVRKPRGTTPKGLSVVASETPHNIDTLPSGGLFAGCGSYFRLEWRANTSEPWRRGDWILLPYVHPVESGVRERFRTAIFEELRYTESESGNFTELLINQLRTNRRRIVDIYSDHFGLPAVSSG